MGICDYKNLGESSKYAKETAIRLLIPRQPLLDNYTMGVLNYDIYVNRYRM